MSRNPHTLTLQAATVLNATETAIHGPMPLENVDFLTIFLTYVKGDETHVDVVPYFYPDFTESGYQWTEWTTAAGVTTGVDNLLRLTATVKRAYTFDVRGLSAVQFFQQATGGTPTGTLAVKITMTGIKE